MVNRFVADALEKAGQKPAASNPFDFRKASRENNNLRRAALAIVLLTERCLRCLWSALLRLPRDASRSICCIELLSRGLRSVARAVCVAVVVCCRVATVRFGSVRFLKPFEYLSPVSRGYS